jgi:hypothetical protein
MSDVNPLFSCKPLGHEFSHNFKTMSAMQSWIFRNPRLGRLSLENVEIHFKTQLGSMNKPVILAMERLHFQPHLLFSDLAVAQDLFSCLNKGSFEMMNKLNLPDWFLITKNGKPTWLDKIIAWVKNMIP